MKYAFKMVPVHAPNRKKIHRNSLIGQEGINIIEEIVLKMGNIWVPGGAIEAGIDGTIEIREPETGELLHSIIRVQSKATAGPFSGDDGKSFEFTCDDRDLQYWLTGNVPVIIIRSRTDTREAYWVSIKDYFLDPKRRASRRITFDKTRDRFSPDAAKALRDLAIPSDAGLYFAPQPKPEILVSNLLHVSRLPSRLFHAITEYGTRDAIRQAFRSRSRSAPREFVARGKTILSVHDLGDANWEDIADPGTVEEFETSEWAESDDEQQRRDFVELLGHCLTERLSGRHVTFHEKREIYYFSATPDLKRFKVKYQSEKQWVSKEVFGPRVSKQDSNRISYFRHSSFSGHFSRHDGVWYLELNPTYHFTSDGYRTERFRADHLTGIKRLEHNQSVLGQLRMWAHILGSPANLFENEYPHLGFDQLERFKLSCGIDDSNWAKREDESLTEDADEGSLFD